MIEKLPDFKTKFPLQSVYDLENIYTLQELLSGFQDVINNCVDRVNSYEELVQYMENEGIEKIATDKVLELINQSFIDNSVNTILDNKIAEISSRMSNLETILNQYKTEVENTYQTKADANIAHTTINNTIQTLSNNLENNYYDKEETLQKIVDSNLGTLYRLTDGSYVDNFLNVSLSTLYNEYDSACNDITLVKNVYSKDSSNLYDLVYYVYTPSNGYEKTILLTSTVHGDEKVYPILLAKLMKMLTNQENCLYNIEDLKKARIVIAPVLNPYGYVNTQRKNYNGVDLNRNWDYKWSEVGSSVPTDLDYRGSVPFSEVETQFAKYLLETYLPDGYIDLHNFGEDNKGQDYCIYYSQYSENIYKEVVEQLKQPDEIANYYLQGQDSCGANYFESVYSKPSMTLEFIFRGEYTLNADNYKKAFELFINHLVKYSAYQIPLTSYNGNKRIDVINWESANGIDIPYSSNLQIMELFDKPLSYSKNGILMINGFATFTCLSNTIPNNTSTKTISCLPEIEDMESNTISERQGASFASGDYSVSLPCSIVIQIEKNKRYNFRFYCCYDGDTTYVAKLKRVKYNFVFIGD